MFITHVGKAKIHQCNVNFLISIMLNLVFLTVQYNNIIKNKKINNKIKISVNLQLSFRFKLEYYFNNSNSIILMLIMLMYYFLDYMNPY